MDIDADYEVYRIGDQYDNYAVSLATNESIYDGQNSYRKAHRLRTNPRQNRNVFTDETFQLDIGPSDLNDKKQRFAERRLYQIYDKQYDIFMPQLMAEIPLKPRNFYPTFLSEFSMIDKVYLQTLFITKRLNEKGFYKYFVRRNGEYYVQFMDDTIPVDPDTRLPPWGLSESEPWKIIVMKAWLKEKGSIAAMINAEPYQFIQAFGFPGYRTLSIKKQLNHLAVSTLKQSSKAAKQHRIPLDVPGFIVVGKTRNSKQVEEMGLVANRAGYRITKARIQNQSVLQSSILDVQNHQLLKQNVYKINSSLPSSWVGEFSIFANGKIHNPKYSKLHEDIVHIQNQFFASYPEISQIFSKFYMVPEYTSNKLSGHLLEDSISVVYEPKQYHVFELRVKSKGFININIDLPYHSGEDKEENGKSSRRYSYIKYFMAKREVKQSSDNELKGYTYYDGEYVKGYHKSCNRFLQIQPGIYYIYFKIQPNNSLYEGHIIAININSNATITKFNKVQPKTVNFPTIMQSALHNYNLRYGLKMYAGKKNAEKTKNLGITVSNSFDQIGFGVISIHAKAPTQMMLAMNIHTEHLKANNLGICPESQEIDPKVQNKGPLNIFAKQGEAKAVIVERLVRSRQTYEVFPPHQSVDFYHVM